MLLGAGGERIGLLSGGCLETDLAEHAQRLLSGTQRIFEKTYDSRTSDDPVWGLGLGCEGSMRIALLRLEVQDHYLPIGPLLRAQQDRQRAVCAINLQSGASAFILEGIARGDVGLIEMARPLLLSEQPSALHLHDDQRDVFVLAAERMPALLICGAGPDAQPVANFASALGWQLTIVDHRPAYIDAARFPARTCLVRVEADQLASHVDLSAFDAAVVMSHHLIADGHYLAALAGSTVAYVGLLGPAARRERLFAELGDRALALRARLRAPVGLDLGGRTPEAIALSVIAEIQASLHGRNAAPFSAR